MCYNLSMITHKLSGTILYCRVKYEFHRISHPESHVTNNTNEHESLVLFCRLLRVTF